jgi:hypothetical protein
MKCIYGVQFQIDNTVFDNSSIGYIGNNMYHNNDTQVHVWYAQRNFKTQ